MIRGGIYTGAFLALMVAMGLTTSWWALLACPAACWSGWRPAASAGHGDVPARLAGLRLRQRGDGGDVPVLGHVRAHGMSPRGHSGLSRPPPSTTASSCCGGSPPVRSAQDCWCMSAICSPWPRRPVGGQTADDETIAPLMLPRFGTIAARSKRKPRAEFCRTAVWPCCAFWQISMRALPLQRPGIASTGGARDDG